MFFIKIYIKENYMNCYHTSIQMCGQYCILAPLYFLRSHTYYISFSDYRDYRAKLDKFC